MALAPPGRLHSVWARAQAYAGLAIGGFLVQHVGAALYVRHVAHLDTNFYWAASVIYRTPLAVYLGPYYFVGVAALFVHAAVAPLIVLSLAGAFYPIHLPAGYR